jgi:universal stress protein E
MDIRRILVAVADCGAKPAPELHKAAELARRFDATLTLFHSLYSPYVAGEQFYSPDALQKDIEGAVHARRQQLARLAVPLRQAGLRVRERVRWDYPVHDSIVREALREKADLVVAGSHRHTRIARVLLSNTDWQLIRLCPVPLLFVKGAKPWERLRVLAAVDPLHAHARPAALDTTILGVAARLADTFQGRMHALHVWHLATPFAAGVLMEPVPLPVNLIEQQRQHVRREFETLLAPWALPASRRHLRTGLPATEIAAVAAKIDAGIVVMGAVSRSGLRRLFIGSTAESAIDALGCDVLVLKPAGFRSPVPRRHPWRPVALPPL